MPLSDWLTPNWPAPAGVRAVCTTRAGGVSGAPFDSFNLGEHVGDKSAHVAANRAKLHTALGARPVFLNQVHGVEVAHLMPASPHGTVADACVTDQPGVACTVMVADCLPVLFAHQHSRVVAAAHAGWRGLLGQASNGVLEETFKHFSALVPFNKALVATNTIAWLGPCIGPTAFDVGAEVRAACVAATPVAEACFTPLVLGKCMADLAALARLRLRAMGITQVFGNDSSAAWCTVSNPSRFFSYRRDHVSGRFCASIWLQA